MLFNSWQYIVFLPLVVLVYYLLPHRFRWAWLLIVSYYFYMSWNAKLVVLISGTTFISWGAGMLMERSPTKARRRLWLVLAAVVSLGILFFFKYFDFVTTSIAAVANRIGLPVDPFMLNLILPVGISFYTFQTLGYVIDVYRGDLKAEHHFGIYALFVSFFPQLVAGPIERATNLLPQFYEVHTPDAGRMAWGLRYICWGLLKKVVIADYVATFVNAAYNNLSLYTPMTWVLATLLFAIQIFCDFSGYTDIARGSAAMMGFDLMQNFNAPYLARSVREFWRRWHISLSTWFMDYVYIPLGGSRVGKFRHIFNLFITFVLSGLWHGAKWNFVLWGTYHGIFVVLDALTSKLRNKWEAHIRSKPALAMLHALQVFLTFLVVCFGWMMFRANDLPSIMQIIQGLPEAFSHPVANMAEAFTSLVGGGGRLVRILAGAMVLFIFDAILYRSTDPFVQLARRKSPTRIFVSYALAMVVLLGALTMPEGVAVEFIYFQF